jgi:hypothetical protein
VYRNSREAEKSAKRKNLPPSNRMTGRRSLLLKTFDDTTFGLRRLALFSILSTEDAIESVFVAIRCCIRTEILDGTKKAKEPLKKSDMVIKMNSTSTRCRRLKTNLETMICVVVFVLWWI